MSRAENYALTSSAAYAEQALQAARERARERATRRENRQTAGETQSYSSRAEVKNGASNRTSSALLRMEHRQRTRKLQVASQQKTLASQRAAIEKNRVEAHRATARRVIKHYFHKKLTAIWSHLRNATLERALAEEKRRLEEGRAAAFETPQKSLLPQSMSTGLAMSLTSPLPPPSLLAPLPASGATATSVADWLTQSADSAAKSGHIDQAGAARRLREAYLGLKGAHSTMGTANDGGVASTDLPAAVETASMAALKHNLAEARERQAQRMAAEKQLIFARELAERARGEARREAQQMRSELQSQLRQSQMLHKQSQEEFQAAMAAKERQKGERERILLLQREEFAAHEYALEKASAQKLLEEQEVAQMQLAEFSRARDEKIQGAEMRQLELLKAARAHLEEVTAENRELSLNHEEDVFRMKSSFEADLKSESLAALQALKKEQRDSAQRIAETQFKEKRTYQELTQALQATHEGEIHAAHATHEAQLQKVTFDAKQALLSTETELAREHARHLDTIRTENHEKELRHQRRANKAQEKLRAAMRANQQIAAEQENKIAGLQAQFELSEARDAADEAAALERERTDADCRVQRAIEAEQLAFRTEHQLVLAEHASSQREMKDAHAAALKAHEIETIDSVREAKSRSEREARIVGELEANMLLVQRESEVKLAQKEGLEELHETALAASKKEAAKLRKEVEIHCERNTERGECEEALLSEKLEQAEAGVEQRCKILLETEANKHELNMQLLEVAHGRSTQELTLAHMAALKDQAAEASAQLAKAHETLSDEREYSKGLQDSLNAVSRAKEEATRLHAVARQELQHRDDERKLVQAESDKRAMEWAERNVSEQMIKTERAESQQAEMLESLLRAEHAADIKQANVEFEAKLLKSETESQKLKEEAIEEHGSMVKEAAASQKLMSDLEAETETVLREAAEFGVQNRLLREEHEAALLQAEEKHWDWEVAVADQKQAEVDLQESILRLHTDASKREQQHSEAQSLEMMSETASAIQTQNEIFAKKQSISAMVHKRERLEMEAAFESEMQTQDTMSAEFLDELARCEANSERKREEEISMMQARYNEEHTMLETKLLEHHDEVGEFRQAMTRMHTKLFEQEQKQSMEMAKMLQNEIKAQHIQFENEKELHKLVVMEMRSEQAGNASLDAYNERRKLDVDNEHQEVKKEDDEKVERIKLLANTQEQLRQIESEMAELTERAEAEALQEKAVQDDMAKMREDVRAKEREMQARELAHLEITSEIKAESEAEAREKVTKVTQAATLAEMKATSKMRAKIEASAAEEAAARISSSESQAEKRVAKVIEESEAAQARLKAEHAAREAEIKADADKRVTKATRAAALAEMKATSKMNTKIEAKTAKIKAKAAKEITRTARAAALAELKATSKRLRKMRKVKSNLKKSKSDEATGSFHGAKMLHPCIGLSYAASARRLYSFYSAFAPKKLEREGSVHLLLLKYEGKESLLWRRLYRTYSAHIEEHLAVLGVKYPPRQTDENINAIVQNLLKDARHQFDLADSDKSGFIEGDEIDKLTNWMLSKFHPNQDHPISVEHADRMTRELMDDLDDNSDGVLSFEEFKDWFENKSGGIIKTLEYEDRYRRFCKFASTPNNKFLDDDDTLGSHSALNKYGRSVATASQLGFDRARSITETQTTSTKSVDRFGNSADDIKLAELPAGTRMVDDVAAYSSDGEEKGTPWEERFHETRSDASLDEYPRNE